MAETSKTLAERIAAAGLDVGGKLQPDKTNAEQRYDYISADKILAMCGQALFGQGVTVFPGVTSREVNMFEYTDSYGKAKRRYDAQVVLSMTISCGGDGFTCLWTGAGSDYSVPDKAVYKAITSGHKYFLMKLLCIGAGNEDSEHEDDTPTGKQKQQPTNGKPAAQPANGGMKEAAQAMGATVTDAQPAMTLETAMAVTNSEGVKYGELDSEKLSHMSASIIKALKTAAPEQREAYVFKHDAIATILASRAEAQPTE